MFVIAGATGHVGSATANRLIADGADVRVLVRRPQAAEAWESRGAEARIVGLDDRAGLTDALGGCAGFFVLLPFDPAVEDVVAHTEHLIASIAGAVAAAEVPHVVMLSSVGADLPEDTGPIVGLHHLENALRATGATLTALRPGHFQEKVGDVLGAARSEGIYPVFSASADRPHPMVATRDIGEVAAAALQSPPSASEVVDIVGPSYAEAEVASALGDALGTTRPVVTIPEEGWSPALQQAGLPAQIADALAEMYRAEERGLLQPRGDRAVRVDTPITETIATILA